MAQEFDLLKIGGVPINACDAVARKQIGDVAENIDDLTAVIQGNAFYGLSRVSNADDPSLGTTYGDRTELLKMLSHFKIGVFEGSDLQHQCAPGRLTLGVDGHQIALDGSDGDIMPYIDHHLYVLRTTETISSAEHSVIGFGLAPFQIGNVQAKKQMPFSAAMNGCVNTQLSNDTRACAHSIYNTNVAGYYQADAGFFKQHYRTSGNGYPDTHVSAIAAYIAAQDRNADNTHKGDAKPLFHDFLGLWYMAMYLELGTLDFTAPNKFGYGCTNTAADSGNWADEGISGISGMKTITAGGTARHYPLCSQNMKLNSSANAIYNTGCLTGDGDRYNFTECLEIQRVLDKIHSHALTLKIGTYTNIFTDGGATCISDGSVNLTTGEGMEAGKKYYVVRNVPNCQGLADGVMTAVVNVYLKMECADGVQNSDGDDLTDGVCIYKMSHAIYRGVDLLDGKFIHIAGSHYVYKTDSSGNHSLDYYCCQDAEALPIVRNTQADYYVNFDAEDIPFLSGYEESMTGITSTDGWAKKCLYNLSLWAYHTLGSSMHYGENGYVWKNSSWGSPNGQYPANGKKCVNASVAGCHAHPAAAGRTCFCSHAVSHSNDFYARGFAQVNINI